MVDRYRCFGWDIRRGEMKLRGEGEWVLYSDYARLQEQLAAQIDGHQLTAKEATANLLRANRIEAGLEEMTRSCLAERDGRLAAEADLDRLREALRNLAHEMRFLLRTNPNKDGGLYRQRLDEAEAALKENCQHNCNEGGICLASFSGYPESCPSALQKEPQP